MNLEVGGEICRLPASVETPGIYITKYIAEQFVRSDHTVKL